MPENLWQRFYNWIGKTFRLGSAVVLPSEEAWGHVSEHVSESWGDYIAQSVAVYACATLRAKNLARLPLRLYRLSNGERREVTKGALYELLQKVNPFWTRQRLLEMSELSLCLWGQSHWCLERGPNGRAVPQEIWWARPDRMKPMVHQQNYLVGFEYEHMGTRIPWRRDEVVWLRYSNPLDEFAGLSPLASARLSVDLGIEGLRSNKRLFDQGMQLGGIISPSDSTVRFNAEQVKQLEEHFARRFAGVDRAHRWAVLGGDVKATPLGVNPKDMEFVSQLRWTLNDVCRVYGVPPVLVGDLERATYSNIDAAYKQFWSDTLVPEAEMIEAEITEQLLPLFPGEADLVEFDVSAISALQENRAQIVEQMARLWQIGVPLNPLLRQFMPQLLPPEGGGYPWGDVWWAPNTLLEAGTVPEPQPPSEPAARALYLVRQMIDQQRVKTVEFASAEHERMWKAFVRRSSRAEAKIREAVQELWRRQQEAVLARLRGGKAVKSAEDAVQEPFDLARWGKEFKQALQPILSALLEESAQDALDDLRVGVAFDVSNPEVVRWLERRAQRFARQVNETTWEQLRASLGEGLTAGESIAQLSERVRTVFAEATTSRAETIARTEAVSASNAGALLAAKQSGVVRRKVWIAALDERTRPAHLEAHGQVRDIDEPFTVGGEEIMQPGEGSAENAVNCRCTLTWEIGD